MAGKALHILNAVAQLDSHRDRLAAAAVVVCDLGFDVPTARRKIGAAPELIGSFSPGKMFMGGRANPFWNRFRTVLGSTAYTPFCKDPGDSSDHLLVNPTVENAERLGRFLLGHFGTSQLTGLYADDSWWTKPDRLIQEEARVTGFDPQILQARWQAYLHVLFSMLEAAGVPVWSNCAGDPPHPSVAISCEAPRPEQGIPSGVTPKQMVEIVVDEVLTAGHHILWYGKCGVEGLFLEGETL